MRTDLDRNSETICRLVMMNLFALGQDPTAIALALETDLVDMIPGNEAEAAFATTKAIDSTAQARQADPDLEIYIRNGTINIRVSTRHYDICHVWDVEAPKTHKLTAREYLSRNKSRESL